MPFGKFFKPLKRGAQKVGQPAEKRENLLAGPDRESHSRYIKGDVHLEDAVGGAVNVVTWDIAEEMRENGKAVRRFMIVCAALCVLLIAGIAAAMTVNNRISARGAALNDQNSAVLQKINDGNLNYFNGILQGELNKPGGEFSKDDLRTLSNRFFLYTATLNGAKIKNETNHSREDKIVLAIREELTPEGKQLLPAPVAGLMSQFGSANLADVSAAVPLNKNLNFGNALMMYSGTQSAPEVKKETIPDGVAYVFTYTAKAGDILTVNFVPWLAQKLHFADHFTEVIYSGENAAASTNPAVN